MRSAAISIPSSIASARSSGWSTDAASGPGFDLDLDLTIVGAQAFDRRGQGGEPDDLRNHLARLEVPTIERAGNLFELGNRVRHREQQADLLERRDRRDHCVG